MTRDILAGRLLVGIAFAAIGLGALLTGHLPVGLIPLKTPLSALLAGLLGTSFAAAVVMAAASCQRNGASAAEPRSRRAALIGAAFPTAAMLLIHLPRLVTEYRDPVLWSSLLQLLFITVGVLLLTSNLRHLRNLRILLAATLVGFGVQHFMYPAFIAGLIPEWLPARTALAWITGGAFIAAAVSFALRRYQLLAGRLLALMWISWVPILHLPRIMAKPEFEPGWTSGLIALGFGGVALLVAGEEEPLPAALRADPIRLATTSSGSRM